MSDGHESNTHAGDRQPEDGSAPLQNDSVDGAANPPDEQADRLQDAAAVAVPLAPWATEAAQVFFLGGDYADVHREDSLGNHWSVPWSDLMMSMFVLFAALVTAQALERKVPEYVDRVQEKIVEQETLSADPSFAPLMRINVFDQSQQAILDANIDNVEIALLDDQSVKVSVQGPMFFDAGKDELRPDVKTFLGKLAKVIRQTPFKVNVVGHTDDTPISNRSFASNWELSLMRATQVTKHLIGAGQIDPARFTILGRSQYDPVTSNADDSGRSLNRRVEIIITRDVTSSLED
ncbi:MAG: flagellar motor protein MotB [Gammaproteobacteria bacterium]|nr:flagellar motor protein MotB [Gammaproteobacteria bacterium]